MLRYVMFCNVTRRFTGLILLSPPLDAIARLRLTCLCVGFHDFENPGHLVVVEAERGQLAEHFGAHC